MARVRQQTLKSPIHCSGVGLHDGNSVSMTLCPAEPGTGIVFRRTDLADGATIAALWHNVVDTRLCTALGNGNGLRVGTVEHLMATFSGCGIDNAVVEIDGPEVPIMDGSAAPFVFLIECAGIRKQTAPRRAIEILKTMTVGDHERTAVLTPGRGFSVSFEIDFENAVVARQDYFLGLTGKTFRSEICRARTFGFDHEVAELRAGGLARGGSLDNAVVISGDRVLNDDGLRYEDEFVRHKVLDCIGDLYLAGAPLVGHYHGYRAGHRLTRELLSALFADKTAWRYTDFDASQTPSTAPAAAWSEAPIAASA